MGTRNVTIVIQKEKPKVAKYCQWDGYPEGQGVDILNILYFFNAKQGAMDDFKKKVSKVKFFNKAKWKEYDEFCNSIGAVNGFNMEQVRQRDEKYPYLSRDIGGDILLKIYEAENPSNVLMINDYKFIADGLFCEWAYVIDLDKNTFEVYEGFNDHTPLTETDRFYKLDKPNVEYHPAILVKSYDLSNLPTEQEFIDFFKKKDDDE